MSLHDLATRLFRSGNSEQRRPQVQPGERPIKVFLSSVMREEFNAAREAIVESIVPAPFMNIWAFEFTPASAEQVDSNYLRHVRESELVIWLVTSSVTEPVVNEIREALSAKRKILVFRYAEHFDQATQDLINEIGRRAKYAETPDIDSLKRNVSLAITDEIVRSLRGEPGLGRAARIEEMLRESLGRCIVRWQATGVSRDKAIAFSRDLSIGSFGEEVVPSSDRPVSILVGDIGSGKSILAERWHQDGLKAFAGDSNAPLPLWITSAEAQAGLKEAVVERSAGLGNPRTNGAAVVIDGLDESSIDIASEIVSQARELTTTWPATAVLLTSRPSASLSVLEEAQTMPRLSPSETLTIIGRCNEDPVDAGFLEQLPRTVRDATDRPLFALLVGVWRAERGEYEVRSEADLLTYLGERSVSNVSDDTQSALRSLAVASVRRGLTGVPVAELEHLQTVRELQDSGLVVETHGLISIGLPMLTQWFAGQALLRGEVRVEDLAGEPDEIDLWRYPIAMAVANASYEQTTEMLAPLLAALPGFAFLVLHETLRVPGAGEGALPPWREAGEQLRKSMQMLVDSLPVIGVTIGLTNPDGKVLPLGLEIGDGFLGTYFCSGDDVPEELFRVEMNDRRLAGGYSVRSGTPIASPSWAWGWCWEEFQDNVARAVKDRGMLSPVAGPQLEEELWEAFINLGKVSRWDDGEVVIETVLSELKEPVSLLEGVPAESIVHVGPAGQMTEARHLITLLELAKSVGYESIRRPLPGRDQEPVGNHVVDLFTPERLNEIAVMKYEKAFVIYEQLVDTYFPTVKNRLEMAVTMPTKYVGFLQTEFENAGMRAAVMGGYFYPLERDAVNVVEIELTDDAREGIWGTRVDDFWDTIRARRPEAARWIGGRSSYGVFDPAPRFAISDLAYSWLWSDLTKIGLADGFLGEHPRRTGLR